MQEGSLAQVRQPLIGLHSFCWDRITALLKRQHSLCVFKQKNNFADRFESSPIVHQHAATKFWQELKTTPDNNVISLGILLCSFLAQFGQYLKAEQPEDKVLAFMSLWNPPSFKISETTGKTPCQVYSKLAWSLIKDTKRLDVLAALRPPIEDFRASGTSHPSWAPRWDSVSRPSPLLAALYFERIDEYDSRLSSPSVPLPTPSTIGWKASSPHDDHIPIEPDKSKLKTRGRIIFSVRTVLPPVTQHPVGDEDVLEQFRQSLSLGKVSISLSQAMEILIECTKLGRPDEYLDSKTLTKFQEMADEEEAPSPNQHSSTILWGLETAFEIESRLYNSIGRRFFTAMSPKVTKPSKATKPSKVTKSSKMTESLNGLGPGLTNLGDQIAILHGARFPVILRKAGQDPNTYQVIGDCCIPGIMKGEMVDWKEEEAADIWLV